MFLPEAAFHSTGSFAASASETAPFSVGPFLSGQNSGVVTGV